MKGNSNKAIKVVRGLAIALTAVLLLCGAAVVGITLWLTPQRLGRIVSQELSKELGADVRASDISWTFWSSIPRLVVSTDTVSVVSRNFRQLPADKRRLLPAGADTLALSTGLHGAVNVPDLFRSRLSLSELRADSVSVNIVAFDSALNNYTFRPIHEMTRKMQVGFSELHLVGPVHLRYFQAGNTDLRLLLSSLHFDTSENSGRYALKLGGVLNLSLKEEPVLHDFPFAISTDVNLDTKPLRIHTDDFRARLDGTSLRLTLDMTLDGTARFNSASVKIRNLDYPALTESVPLLRQYIPAGLNAALQLDLDAALDAPYAIRPGELPAFTVNFRIPEASGSYPLQGSPVKLDRLAADGTFRFDGKRPEAAALTIGNFMLEDRGARLSGSGSVRNLLTDPHVRADLRGQAQLSTISALLPAGSMQGYTADGKLSADVSLDALVSQLRNGNFKHFMLHGDISAPSLHVANPAQGLDLRVNNLKLKCAYDSIREHTSLAFHSGPLALRSGTTKLQLSKTALSVRASHRTKSYLAPAFTAPQIWNADGAATSPVAHQNPFLTFGMADMVGGLSDDWDANVAISTGSGRAIIGGKPPVNIRRAELALNLDSLQVRALELGTCGTEVTVTGCVSNLRQFITSSTPVPLPAKFDIGIDTLQINRLARAYWTPVPMAEASRLQPGDTVAMLLPRNLLVDLKIRARDAIYTSYTLSPLSAGIHLENGNLAVNSLHIGTPFADAKGALTFNTSDMQDMSLNYDVALGQMDTEKIFAEFPQIMDKMPQLSDVSARLGASSSGGFLFFPTMWVNNPSIHGTVDLDVKHLTVKQWPELRHYTRWLMIPDGEVSFHNFDIHASLLDNIVDVDPFTIAFSRYSLTFMGLGNLEGKIYAHAGVNHSPLHIPFGINVQGDMHHPHISLGGRAWKDRNAMKVTPGEEPLRTLNLMQATRKFFTAFLNTAATFTPAKP